MGEVERDMTTPIKHKEKGKVDEHDIWRCETCSKKPEFSKKIAFIEHMKTAHGLVKPSGLRQMSMHLDGTNWFQTVYDWDIADGKVKATQDVLCKRSHLWPD